ncbi:MAG: class I SAM-dependent methyltransferase [Myxococcota bacterium]
MGKLLAALYDPVMRRAERAGVAAWRRELLADLAGTVVEVGAGTGANAPHYPPGLDRLVLTEPDAAMRARIRGEVVDAPAEHLPFPDASADAVVCTLVLCSVANQGEALDEIARVLKPGGRLVFLEHVADPERIGLQRAIEPVWTRLAGNCHLTRDTLAAIAERFDVAGAIHGPLPGALPWLRASVRGAARKR